MRIRTLTLSCLTMAFAFCATAVDIPGDETTNKKLLARWQSDPERMEKLRRNLAEFRDLPKEAQDRIRRLDKSLHDQDVTEANRLRGIMERYAGWVARLKDEDRAKLLATPPGPERVRKVQELLDQQWQESLPKADKDKLAKATTEDRVKLLDELRKHDEDRRKQRQSARRSVEEAAAFGPFGGDRERFSAFFDESLKPLLSEADVKKLVAPINRRDAVARANYLNSVNELAKAVEPMPFPGPAPPGKSKAVRTWADLPSEWEPKFPKPMPNEITKAVGKWPDFALAVAKVAKQNNIDMPGRLFGPTQRDELPPSVKRFVTDLAETSGKLSDEEKSRLNAAEGNWPDYPKLIKKLADDHKLTVPGLTRPISPELPAGKNKGGKGTTN